MTNTKFMNVAFLAFFFSFFCFGFDQAKGAGPPSSMQTYTFLSPAVFSSNPAFVQNALMSMVNGATSAGMPGTPSYWESLVGPNFSILSSDVVYTPNGYSWRGRIVDGGQYGTQRGNGASFGLSATSVEMFSLEEISFSLKTPDYHFVGTADLFTGLSLGIIKGLNGQPDTFVWSPSPTQKFNTIAVIGPSYALQINSVFGEPYQQTIDNELNAEPYYVGASYTLDATYTLGDTSRTLSIQVMTVPEPPTLTIVPAGPGEATLSWSPATPGFVLQETLSLSPTNWANSPSGQTNPIVVPSAPQTKYYRLFKP